MTTTTKVIREIEIPDTIEEPKKIEQAEPKKVARPEPERIGV